MDDRRTPMEAEVQELLPAAEHCADDSYGTAVRPRPRRSYAGLWVSVGLVVITLCSFCVVAALSQLRLENGDGRLRFAMHSPEETQTPENAVVDLPPSNDGTNISRGSTEAGDVKLPLADSSDKELTPAEIYARVSPAVVCVQAESYYGESEFTGVVVNANGYILTAADGLTNAVSISVSFSDGTVLSARRLGEDPVSGVTLLKAEATGLKTVRFSEKSDFTVGQSVYCISNPYGSTVPNVFSDGMLSVSRSIELDGNSYALLHSSAQQETAGWGCPLLDEKGLVIGLTSPIGKRFVSGTDPCFAIASADLARIVTAFENTASGSSVWLGLEVEDIPDDYQYLYGFPGCVWIREVAPGSASYGVLFQFDVILAVDGVEISSAAEYESILSAYEPGDHALLTIYRSGKRYQILLPVLAK